MIPRNRRNSITPNTNDPIQLTTADGCEAMTIISLMKARMTMNMTSDELTLGEDRDPITMRGDQDIWFRMKIPRKMLMILIHTSKDMVTTIVVAVLLDLIIHI